MDCGIGIVIPWRALFRCRPMPVPGLSLLGLKCIRGFVSILRYINPTIIIIIIIANSRVCYFISLPFYHQCKGYYKNIACLLVCIEHKGSNPVPSDCQFFRFNFNTFINLLHFYGRLFLFFCK